MCRVHLEISGRRTGKTSRLIQAFYKNDCEGFIVIPSITMRNFYPRRIRHKVITPEILKLHSGLYSRQIWPEKDRLYWDEFDLNDDCTEFIKDGDYYYTTPKKIRKPSDFEFWRSDMLLCLLHRNRHDFQHYAWDKAPWVNSLKRNWSTEQYVIEVKGKYELSFKEYTELENGD